MSCGAGENGQTKYRYTGGQVGDLNQTGDFNFVSGGPASAGLSAGLTIGVFFATGLGRRLWLNDDAQMGDKLLDACYPTIALRWIADIELSPEIKFRISNQSFYVQDADGINRFYDARAERAPTITVDTGEWLSQAYKISDLNLTLNNRDGFFNAYLPLGADFRQWTNAKVTVRVGFGELYSNYFTLFEGQITEKQGIETSRDSIQLRAYDKLALDDVPIPPRTFSSDIFPTMDSNNAGKPIPLVYGDWTTEINDWGNVAAICTNGTEEDAETYNFKVSDLALETLDSVFLHRGDRTADKPFGPIHITSPAISFDIENGEFDLSALAPVLDDAHLLIDKQKCGQGTSGSTIISDGSIDFEALGIKVNDIVFGSTDVAASMTQGNLQFISLIGGAAGENISVELVYNTIDNDVDQTVCTVSVVGDAITVGIPRSLDESLVTVIGADTAADIRTAIAANSAAAARVHVKFVGAVPIDPQYTTFTKPSAVHQDPFGQTYLDLGNPVNQPSRVLSVTNFTLGIDNNTTSDVYAPDHDFSVETVQYTFQSNDKFSVICKGKPLNLLSITRLADVSSLILEPSALTLGFDSTYWIADDTTQKIYNLSFDNEILQEILYSDLDGSVTRISGLAVASGRKIWVADPDTSRFYQYDYDGLAVLLNFSTTDVTGIGTPMVDLSGIALQPDNRLWFVDNGTDIFYLIDSMASIPNTTPNLVRSFTNAAFDSSATDILGLTYDTGNQQICCVDRATNKFFRLDDTDGSLVSALDLEDISSDISYSTGVALGQDGTLFILDAGTLAIYNYNERDFVNDNPGYIARDLLQKFGGHNYANFDFNWNVTSDQLEAIKARLVVDKSTTLIAYLNLFLKQFNVVFSLRFNKFSLFWITFANFNINGKAVSEKDIKKDSFEPKKEINQYFNTALCTYQVNPFTTKSVTSDTYVSSAGIAFAGREINRKLDLPALYRRTDIDRIMPLMVRLAVPEPEFVDVTFGFRLIRSQIQDFLMVNFFDDQVDPKTGNLKVSGRRFDNIPCMIRKIQYDLGPMTVAMKLWSLGTTAFAGYTPGGASVGGEFDRIVLTNLGRLGRVSPTGTITAHSTNTLTLADAEGDNAEDREGAGGKCWLAGYRVDLVNGATREVVQTLTVASVSNSVVTFEETFTTTPTNTVKNTAGFVTGGHFLQYAQYNNLTDAQRGIFGSFSNPSSNYPTSQSQEVEEQRSGLHDFAAGGQPYVLYPAAYVGL